jgi:hypothetical protein
VSTEPTLKASVTIIANGRKVGEGNLEKTFAAQCGQLTKKDRSRVAAILSGVGQALAGD